VFVMLRSMEILLQLRTRIRFVLLSQVKEFLGGLISCIRLVLFTVLIVHSLRAYGHIGMIIMVQGVTITETKAQRRRMIMVLLCRGRIVPFQPQVRIAFGLCFDQVFIMV
jgi:hypothetical protein